MLGSCLLGVSRPQNPMRYHQLALCSQLWAPPETHTVSRIDDFSLQSRFLLCSLLLSLSSPLVFVVWGSIWTSFWRPWDIKNIANLTKMKRKAVACNAYTIALSSHFSATPGPFEHISYIFSSMLSLFLFKFSPLSSLLYLLFSLLLYPSICL